MSIWLVIVVLAIPGAQGQQELVAELHREIITASSARVFQQHADKRAEEQRQKSGAAVKGRVFGVCVLQGEVA